MFERPQEIPYPHLIPINTFFQKYLLQGIFWDIRYPGPKRTKDFGTCSHHFEVPSTGIQKAFGTKTLGLDSLIISTVQVWLSACSSLVSDDIFFSPRVKRRCYWLKLLCERILEKASKPIRWWLASHVFTKHYHRQHGSLHKVLSITAFAGHHSLFYQ